MTVFGKSLIMHHSQLYRCVSHPVSHIWKIPSNTQQDSRGGPYLSFISIFYLREHFSSLTKPLGSTVCTCLFLKWRVVGSDGRRSSAGC